MSSNIKYIGLESRVKFQVLESAILDYLVTGTFDKEQCLSNIMRFTKGENRAGKILKHISNIITKNQKILKCIIDNRVSFFTDLLPEERKSVIISLFCNSFPIGYDILIGFAQAFKVQDLVSKYVILNKIGSVYGSNRAMVIAVTEFLSFAVECGLLIRSKTGIYCLGQAFKVNNQLVKEIIVFTDIKLSGSKTILSDEINSKPWYKYFDFMNQYSAGSILIVNKESMIGKGYLSIKN